MATRTRSSSNRTSNRSSSNRSVSSLNRQLASVSAQAKGLGIDTRKADAMVKQTNREGSKSFSGSREERAYNDSVITSADIAPKPKINLPPPVVPVVPDIAANNVGFNDPATGVTAGPNGSLTVTDPNDKYAGASKIQNDFQTALAQLNAPTGADIQRQLEKETGLRKKQQAVNDYSSQLNTIVANRDANKLRVEGQGRGIPEVIIGGQQAQIDKEAAIQALPVQAQLAAAQGNLALAQDHINTWGQIMMTDATNQYNRKKDVLTSVRDFAVGLEFKRIDDLEKANERKYQETQAITKAKAQAMAQALSQPGGSSVIGAIKNATTLDEIVAATGKYNGDVLANQIKQKQLSDLYAPKAPGKRDTQVVDGKLVDMQTGEVISEFGAKAQAVTAQSKQSIVDVDSLLKNKTGLSTAVGTNFTSRSSGFWGTLGKVASVIGIPSALKQAYSKGSGQEQSFIGGVEQMRQQLTLDNLVRAKQNGATFGALSDGERQMLASSATKIGTWAIKDGEGNVTGYNIDQKTFTKEVQAINNFAKIDYLNRGGAPSEIGAVANPDGTVWVKNADGTFTQLK